MKTTIVNEVIIMAPIKLVNREITSEQILKYEKMISMWAKRTAKKMQPWLVGQGYIESDCSLNILGDCLEDIKQEMRIEVWRALQKHDSSQTFVASEEGFVYQFLHHRYSQFIRDMWADKEGQKYRHTDGLQAEVIFNGTDFISLALEALNGKFNGKR